MARGGRCASCGLRDWLTEGGKGAGLFAYSAHALVVVTPDVAVIEPFRSEIARVQRLTGPDVIAELFHQLAQRAAVSEASPPATPYSFTRENAPAAVVVDKPDLAARIDFHAGVTIYGLTVEEPPAMVGDDPD